MLTKMDLAPVDRICTPGERLADVGRRAGRAVLSIISRGVTAMAVAYDTHREVADQPTMLTPPLEQPRIPEQGE